jgi:hypothetical protein
MNFTTREHKRKGAVLKFTSFPQVQDFTSTPQITTSEFHPALRTNPPISSNWSVVVETPLSTHGNVARMFI